MKEIKDAAFIPDQQLDGCPVTVKNGQTISVVSVPTVAGIMEITWLFRVSIKCIILHVLDTIPNGRYVIRIKVVFTNNSEILVLESSIDEWIHHGNTNNT